MTAPISLKEIERKAFLSYHQDGLADICLSLALLTSFIGFIFFELNPVLFTEVLWIIMIAPISIVWLWPIIYVGMKKSFTVSRLGYVEFSPKRTRKTKAIFAMFLIVNIIAFIAGSIALVSREFTAFLFAHFLIILGFIGWLLFSLVAYLSNVQRFYVYGILTAVLFILSFYLNIAFYKPILAMGAVILVTGIALLIRFLRKYP